MKGWGTLKEAAKYAGVSERTLEGWLKSGLRYTQLPSGYRLIKFSWLDEFLESYSLTDLEGKKNTDKIVDEIISKIRKDSKLS